MALETKETRTRSLKGVTKIRTLVDIKGNDDCWDRPNLVVVPAGTILTKEPNQCSTTYGDLFFNKPDGRRVHLSAVKTKHPYCMGFYSPEEIEVVESIGRPVYKYHNPDLYIPLRDKLLEQLPDWVDVSYGNDCCASIGLKEGFKRETLTIMLPNAEVEDADQEEFNTYTILEDGESLGQFNIGDEAALLARLEEVLATA